MTKHIKMINNLSNAQTYTSYCARYCIALDWYKFGTSEFSYTLRRRLCDCVGYDFFDLSKGQKSYISQLSNILANPHYFYYFIKKWVMPLDYVDFVAGCEDYIVAGCSEYKNSLKNSGIKL